MNSCAVCSVIQEHEGGGGGGSAALAVGGGAGLSTGGAAGGLAAAGGDGAAGVENDEVVEVNALVEVCLQEAADEAEVKDVDAVEAQVTEETKDSARWRDAGKGKKVKRKLNQQRGEVVVLEHLRAGEARFRRYQDPEFLKRVHARAKEMKASRRDLRGQEKDQRAGEWAEVAKQVEQRKVHPKKKMFDAAAAELRSEQSTPDVPMAATGCINVLAKTKTEAGAELTKEYLALELERAGGGVQDRDTNGALKLKKQELIDRLVEKKGGAVFARMADPEGGIRCAEWKGGFGATAEADVSSAASATFNGGGSSSSSSGSSSSSCGGGGGSSSSGSCGGVSDDVLVQSSPAVASADQVAAAEEVAVVPKEKKTNKQSKGKGKGNGSVRVPTRHPTPTPRGLKRRADEDARAEEAGPESGTEDQGEQFRVTNSRCGRVIKKPIKS
jgi:uncharacterized membrane protein YgcG